MTADVTENHTIDTLQLIGEDPILWMLECSCGWTFEETSQRRVTRDWSTHVLEMEDKIRT